MKHIYITEKLFFLSIGLIILGLFLPWYAVGDLVLVKIEPLVLRWMTKFTDAGGRFYLPTLDQHFPFGYLSLLGSIFLALLKIRRIPIDKIAWASIAVALFLVCTSVFHYVSVFFEIRHSRVVVDQTLPYPGLYVFIIGSLILFWIGLSGVMNKKNS